MPLVAGEVDERRGEARHLLAQAERAHVAAQERRAARDVDQRVLRAVAMHVIVAPAQVAEVMEQRGERADDEQLFGEALVAVARAALVAVHQPGHRERYVEHVLDVVVLGVAGEIIGMLPAIQARRFAERALQLGRGCAREQALEDAHHLGADRGGVGGAHGIGNVIVATAHAGAFRLPSIGIRWARAHDFYHR